MGDLDQYLQSQAEGGTFESEREFSVNLIAAQQKMGRYALPRRTAWLLKFVQAATEAQCGELKMALHRDRVKIDFPENSLAPVVELRNGLDTLRPRNLTEDHLFGGLLALHSLGGELYLESGKRRWYPAEDRGLEEIDEPSTCPKVVYIPKKRGFWEQIRARLWFTTALMEELQQNCYPSPVELHLDSMPLKFGRGDVPLASGLIKGQAGSELDLHGQLQRETGKKNITFSLWGSSRPPAIGYAVQIRVNGENQPSSLSMEWIRSGVVVKRETIEIRGSKRLIARILISTRGLDFDATGFAIRECDESRERQALGATYLEHAVEAIKGELNREGRWERFLDKNYPESKVPTAWALADQLDSFYYGGKQYFSKSR